MSASADDRDQTWNELLAYVSEGTMSVETAQAINDSNARESRKREAAAQVASGSLLPERAAALLKLG